MALSKVGLIADSTSLTGATLTNANAAGTFTVDQGSSNTNIFSDSVNFTANTTHSGTATFTGTANFDNATVSGVGETWNLLGSNNQTLAVNNAYAVNTAVGIITANLPASASIGDVISVHDGFGFAESNNIIIARNGHNIDGLGKDLRVTIDNQGVKLVYISSDRGWISVKSESRNEGNPFMGEVEGFTTAGDSAAPNVFVSTIEKFPFANPSQSVDTTADLSIARTSVASVSSASHGFTGGGGTPPGNTPSTNLEKFSMISATNGTVVDDLAVATQRPFGISDVGGGNGFICGGQRTPAPAADTDVCERFPFANDTLVNDGLTLSVARRKGSSASSKTHGYAAGGGSPLKNEIDKFPFSNVSATFTDVGDLIAARDQSASLSSETTGYNAGGSNASPGVMNSIDRWPFASDANATDIGNLIEDNRLAEGSSSKTDGFVLGGFNSGSVRVSRIQKFSFASFNQTSEHVGDLTQARYDTSGHQH